MKVSEWVLAARKHARLSQEKLGEHLGKTKGNVSAWENDRHQPSFVQLRRIAAFTNYPLDKADWAELHLDEMSPLTPEPKWSAREHETTYSSLQPILAWEHPDDLPEGEFVMVPRLAVKLSAGNGHEQVEIEFIKGMPQAFRAQWIREQRLKPNKLAAMTADGDSMETTIYDGDSLLVDTSQTDVVDGKVFALWYDGGERVKRLFRLPGGGLRIKSDNSEHPTIEVPASTMEHVRILGRVVHRSGRGGL